MLNCKTAALAKAKFLQNISLDQIEYPVYVDGFGKIACLCIGIGSLMQKTLSPEFKSIFTVYSTDLYWVNSNRLDDVHQLTMHKIIDDMARVIDQLGLNKPVILAHSAYGIVALEAAKQVQDKISGIIMVGSPPAWNNEIISFARKYFDEHASAERKANDKQRKEKFKLIRNPDESDISINAYEADTARYWSNFEINREFLEQLWNGSEADDAVMNHFFNVLLPVNNLEQDIDKISVPVFLAAGRHDYDCVPSELWKKSRKPSDFTMLICNTAGHWPNIETANEFDQAIRGWIKNVFRP